jgi:hypothetical protein
MAENMEANGEKRSYIEGFMEGVMLGGEGVPLRDERAPFSRIGREPIEKAAKAERGQTAPGIEVLAIRNNNSLAQRLAG